PDCEFVCLSKVRPDNCMRFRIFWQDALLGQLQLCDRSLVVCVQLVFYSALLIGGGSLQLRAERGRVIHRRHPGVEMLLHVFELILFLFPLLHFFSTRTLRCHHFFEIQLEYIFLILHHAELHLKIEVVLFIRQREYVHTAQQSELLEPSVLIGFRGVRLPCVGILDLHIDVRIRLAFAVKNFTRNAPRPLRSRDRRARKRKNQCHPGWNHSAHVGDPPCCCLSGNLPSRSALTQFNYRATRVCPAS